MISQDSIDAILQKADIVSLIGEVVPLKKAGSGYKGKSPFSKERTPSFHVSPSKNIFKCFSSGKGGNIFSFFMEHDKLDFPEAVRLVAKKVNLEVVEDNNGDSPEERKRKREEKKTGLQLTKLAADIYYTELRTCPTAHEAHKEVFERRQLTVEEILQWKLGLAPHFTTLARDRFVEIGNLEVAESVNLVRNKNDVLHGRITFALHDINGEVIGLAGRVLKSVKDKSAERGYEAPKYINPKENLLYQKSKFLYGLCFAKEEIERQNKAYLVEGYFDVIAMHKIDLCNTVSCSGTYYNTEQLRILKRYCNEVVILMDGDTAGIKAASKNCEVLLKAGFSVKAIFLPDGEDPDSFIRKNPAPEEYFASKEVDFVLHHAQEMYTKAGDDANEKQRAINAISDYISYMQGSLLRESYKEQIAEAIGVKKSHIKLAPAKKPQPGNKHTSVEDDNDLPPGVSAKEISMYGFYQRLVPGNDKETGIFFKKEFDKNYNAEGFIRVANFTITPLYHNDDEANNLRVMEISNAYDEPRVVEVPTDLFASRDGFRKQMLKYGPYNFRGNGTQYEAIAWRILRGFSPATELTYLGWQPEGFFAWNNYIFNGTLSKFNESGMVKHGNRHYYSPSVANMRVNQRGQNNSYAADKRLSYRESQVNLARWARMMDDAYGESAKTAIGFILMTVFRDIVVEFKNNCPLLYCYGPSKSGKSEFVYSVIHLFYTNYTFCNTSSSTLSAFNERFGQFANCPAVFNEVNEDRVDGQRLEAFKQAYDGESREKIRAGSRKTEFQEIRSSIAIVGQYLINGDDNSLPSRSFLEEFKLVGNDDRPDSQLEAFNKLKDIEKTGLTSMLTELFPHREELAEYYPPEYRVNQKKLIKHGREKGLRFNDRVRDNYCIILTLYQFFCKRVALPWSADTFFEFCAKRIDRDSSTFIKQDILADFWNSFENMYYQGILKHDVHFKVDCSTTQIDLKEEGFTETTTVDAPDGVMYLRIGLVQQLYASFKRGTGDKILSNKNLTDYLKQRDYYLGYKNSAHFTTEQGAGVHKATKTSCHVFDLSKLGMEGLVEHLSSPVNT